MDARTEPELGAPLHWASVDFGAISFCRDTFGSPAMNSDFTSTNRTATPTCVLFLSGMYGCYTVNAVPNFVTSTSKIRMRWSERRTLNDMAPRGPILFGVTALASVVSTNSWSLPEGYHRFAPRTEGFNWGPCDEDVSGSRECSRFEVPLDWANSTAGKATLAVAQYKATATPRLGTLFINPGGPGWDPRGVGSSVPRAECFKTAAEEAAFWEGTIPHAGLEARGNFTDQHDLDVFYEQYIGTAAAVRDMVAMHNILEGPDKPIDFWGLSYGTVIGIYLVNMFPDRVGRVVLDGVVDPVYWANRPAHEMWGIMTESTDEALTGFVTGCAAAGPSGCALATKDSTPESLRALMYGLIDAAYDYKRQVGPNATIGSSDIRSMLYQGMYSPTGWPGLANQLAKCVDEFRNASLLSNSTHKRSICVPLVDLVRRQNTNNGTSEDERAVDYSFQGVTCADAADPGNVTTKDVFDFMVKVSREVSPICNEADPVTPYISAKRVADALGDSAILIEQDDYGHSSLAMHSTCTITALQDYFMSNKLPSQDKLCGTNQELFPGPGVTKATLSKLSAHSLSTNSSSLEEELKDELEKVREHGDKLFIAVIALAAAAGLLLLGVLFSCIRSRQKSKRALATYIPRGAFEKGGEDEGHTYDDPYHEGAVAKPGGYSRVET
ncbi:MEROPS serine peptidase family S33, partial [Rhizoctonia solani]